MADMVPEDTRTQVYRGAPWGQREVWEKMLPQAQQLFLSIPGSQLLPEPQVDGAITPPLVHALVLISTQTSLLAVRNAFLVFPSHFILHLFFCTFSHVMVTYYTTISLLPLYKMPSTL